jgi:hypothetical protein
VAYKLPLVTAIGETPILLKGGFSSLKTSVIFPGGDGDVKAEEDPAA